MVEIKLKMMSKLNEQIKVGYYENVNVGVIRTNGNVATIFPMNIQKNRKGKIIDERKKNKGTNSRKR